MNSITLAQLESLNEQELAKVYKLINKLASKHGKTPPTYHGEGVPEYVDELYIEEPDEGDTGVHLIDKKKATQSTEPFNKKRSLREELIPGASEGLAKGSDPRRMGKEDKNYTRREPIQTQGYRPNKFFELMDGGTRIADIEETSEEDKKWKEKENKIWQKNHKNGRRQTRPSSLVDVTCDGCRQTFEVAASLVTSNKFLCNSCICRRKG